MLTTITDNLQEIISISSGENHRLLNATDTDSERLDLVLKLARQLVSNIDTYNNNSNEDFVIEAEAYTDDHLVEVSFDAVKYFEQAKDDAIISLITCGFGGDYPADAVVDFFQGQNKEVDQLFFHTGGDIGFECIISSSDAEQWIIKNRPQLVKYLDV